MFSMTIFLYKCRGEISCKSFGNGKPFLDVTILGFNPNPPGVKQQRSSSTNSQAIKALPPPSSLMAIGT